MRDDLNMWLLPLGVLGISALIALIIVLDEPSLIDRSPVEEAAQRVAGKADGDCSGASSNDYACYQARYQNLVNDSGVEAAFAELKDEYEKNGFVKSQCHQLTHVIGRAALNLYGDLPSTYGRGDNFCASGYYHGAMEAVVANIGADKILEEANTVCADLGEHQKYSVYHHNCTHGLGHGFMGIQENELFESLQTCDTLKDEWEKSSCYGGVFMENIMAQNNPSHPSKYLNADRPLYPCTDVDTMYKPACYNMQTSYALQVQGNDFAKVFDLCSTVEDDYRPTCYQSLGRDASGNSLFDLSKTRTTCMLGEDYEARSNCLIGAVRDNIYHYHSDEQAKELCESLQADLRDMCLQAVEEYYKSFQV